jgi:hypothetical protein
MVGCGMEGISCQGSGRREISGQAAAAGGFSGIYVTATGSGQTSPVDGLRGGVIGYDRGVADLPRSRLSTSVLVTWVDQIDDRQKERRKERIEEMPSDEDAEESE